jgi:hypothetical protein
MMLTYSKALFMLSNNADCCCAMQICCTEKAPMRAPSPWPPLRERN